MPRPLNETLQGVIQDVEGDNAKYMYTAPLGGGGRGSWKCFNFRLSEVASGAPEACSRDVVAC